MKDSKAAKASTPGKSGSVTQAKTKTTKKAAEKAGKAAATKVQEDAAAGKLAKKAAKKVGAKASGRASRPIEPFINPEERHRLISEAAFYLAERRGFKGGNADADWAAAEAEIDQMLLEKNHG
jgi:hypothetical protein